MSGKETNPFGESSDINPFAAPVEEPSKPVEEFNPFAQQQQQVNPSVYTPPQPQPYNAVPATIEPTRAEPMRSEPPPAQVYQGSQFGGGYSVQDDTMRQRQEELERKAAELERREAEIKNIQTQGGMRANNFPPLPSFCCVGPCYYHDITVEIPIEAQKTCKMMFMIWQSYVFALFFNCITSLAALCIGYESGATLFGVGILYVVLFPPMSFMFWYRPIYKALRSGSSFNYMVYFFIFFFQTVLTVLYALGITYVGTCGWINGAGVAGSKIAGREAVSAMFFVSGAIFTILAVMKILVLRKVHNNYRSSGASFEKAQSEFAQGVASNKNVQNAAINAVKAGVSTQR